MKKHLLFLILILSCAFSVKSQDTIWSEDFSGGDIPAGWTNEDLSVHNALFTWCGDPSLGQTNGCPAIWSGGNNSQAPFAAASSSNGFVTMDSDLVGDLTGQDNHLSQLTTPAIDCSSSEEIWFTMQTHIGVFTLDADDHALLRVSTDQIDWDTFKVFPGLTAGATNVGVSRWSKNPHIPYINLSDVAGGQSSVYIQFQWEGNYEYHWSIDDIIITNADPRPANDMRINLNWVSIPMYAQVPASQQKQPIRFMADILNLGSQPQTGVNLNVSIFNDDNGDFVYSDDFTYNTIGVDSLAENEIFDMAYLPDLAAGTYLLSYFLTMDEEDFNPVDNEANYYFTVTDSTYSMTYENTGATRPSTASWNTNAAAFGWQCGNIYYCPEGEGYKAGSITFETQDLSGYAGQFIDVVLYKWNNIDNNDSIDVEEREEIGLNTYVIASDDNGAQRITMPLFNTANPGEEILLEDGGMYLATVRWAPADTTHMAFGFGGGRDYEAAIWADRQIGLARFATIGVVVPNTGFFDIEERWFAGPRAFSNSDVIPVVEFNVTQASGVNTNDLIGNVRVDLAPNPAKDELMLSVQFEEFYTNLSLSVLDINGKTISQLDLPALNQFSKKIDIEDLVSGTYFIRIETEKGILSKKFVKL